MSDFDTYLESLSDEDKTRFIESVKKFEDKFINGNGCTEFFNKFIRFDDVEFRPTHRQLRPEDYGEGGEDEGDGEGDDYADLFWVSLRDFDSRCGDWKDLEHALKTSQKFGFYSYAEMCFIGFSFSPEPDEGYSAKRDFQELIALYFGKIGK